jgi:hypothetical protein
MAGFSAAGEHSDDDPGRARTGDDQLQLGAAG